MAPPPTPRPSAAVPPAPAATRSPEAIIATPTSTPPAIAIPTPAVSAQSFNWWPWLLGGAGLLLLGLLWSRYRRDTPAESTEAPPEPADEPAGAPQSVYRTSGPWLTIALRPVRAGLNMVTAVADCEITIANTGAARAENVRVVLTLLAAHAGQQAEIAVANGEPITRSAVPPFVLEPGETRTFRAVASANLDGLQPMQAGGREMLVPLVLVNVQHRDRQEVEHRTAQGFVVGVERVDSPKLAPFWLDTIRMVEQVAARPNGAPERRRIG